MYNSKKKKKITIFLIEFYTYLIHTYVKNKENSHYNGYLKYPSQRTLNGHCSLCELNIFNFS
jgi:hypothetical protein